MSKSFRFDVSDEPSRDLAEFADFSGVFRRVSGSLFRSFLIVGGSTELLYEVRFCSLRANRAQDSAPEGTTND